MLHISSSADESFTAERALCVVLCAFTPARGGDDIPIVGVSLPPTPVIIVPLLCSLLRTPRGCSALPWAGVRRVLVLALCRSLACLRNSRPMTTFFIVAARAVESSDPADDADEAPSDRAEGESYESWLSATVVSRSSKT